MINLDLLAEKGAIAMKDRDLFQYVDTPEEAFAMLKAGLLEHHLDHTRGDAVPETPELSAQEILGPDIAKTR